MTRPRVRSAVLITVGVVLSGLIPAAAFAAGIEDFGYKNMAAPASRPLAIILMRFEGQPAYVRTSADWDRLVFGNDPTRKSVNGYFHANSGGRFTWSRAGIIGPLSFTAEESRQPELGLLAEAKKKALQSGFNFAAYDTNRDGHVTPDELTLLIVWNLSAGNGANRASTPDCVTAAGATVDLCGSFVIAGHRASLTLMAHELSHRLGAYDLYGSNQGLNWRLSLMGSSEGADGMGTFHLDPWHKMQFGWLEPQMRAIGSAGAQVLRAANTLTPDGALILFDPARGVREFFILEYRTARNTTRLHYDEDVAGSGLVVWQVKHDENRRPIPLPGIANNGFSDYSVNALGAPGLARGGNIPWASDDGTTPQLRYTDGSRAPVRLQVRPFAPTDLAITIDWCRVLPF